MCECVKDKRIKELKNRVDELGGIIESLECDSEFWMNKANGFEEDLGRHRQAWERVVSTGYRCPDTIEFAKKVLDGSAFVKTYPDKYKGEQVLVFSRGVLGENFWEITAASPGAGSYLDLIFEKGECRFMDRAQAEVNPQFKQLIPYVVYVCGDRVFSYVRSKKSGEERLVGNRSIGIGGHINPVDEIGSVAGGEGGPSISQLARAGSWSSIFLKGARREVKEEVHFNKDYALVPEAVINDASNSVGQVHFGVVYIVRIENESDICAREDHLIDGEFIKISELKTVRNDELEGWSKLAVDLL